MFPYPRRISSIRHFSLTWKFEFTVSLDHVCSVFERFKLISKALLWDYQRKISVELLAVLEIESSLSGRPQFFMATSDESEAPIHFLFFKKRVNAETSPPSLKKKKL